MNRKSNQNLDKEIKQGDYSPTKFFCLKHTSKLLRLQKLEDVCFF